jgi:RNA polymerase sigma-70 factor (ECF subfamily)
VEELADIVRRATAGDGRAFEQLMRETSSSVRTVLRQYARSAEDVEDLLQEVFLRALQKLHTLDDPARFTSWVYAIARNAGLDHIRARQRRPTTSLDDQLHEPSDDNPGPVDLAEVRELSRRVQSGAARLSPRDATLLAMVTTLGFTPTDVAGTLGMSHTAAKVAVHRARQRLRNAMLFDENVREGGVAPSVTQSGCDELHDLLARDEVVEAAVHARGCAVCGKAARAG